MKVDILLVIPSYHLDKSLFPHRLVGFLRHLSGSALPSLSGVWVCVTGHWIYIRLGIASGRMIE